MRRPVLLIMPVGLGRGIHNRALHVLRIPRDAHPKRRGGASRRIPAATSAGAAAARRVRVRVRHEPACGEGGAGDEVGEGGGGGRGAEDVEGDLRWLVVRGWGGGVSTGRGGGAAGV